MIYVLGCNHGIQPRDEDWLGGDSPEAKEQKAHFAALIEETIRTAKVELVGEEWGCPETTAAHSVADACQIRWSNINTSPDELDRLGIPRSYTKGNFSDAQKRSWHRQREQIMLRKLQECRGEAENILIICGFDHMEALADSLRMDGVTVQIVDYRKMDWYRPGAFPEDP